MYRSIFVIWASDCFLVLCLQTRDNRSINEKLAGLETSYTAESEKLRNELGRLRGVEEDAKNKGNQVSSLLEELERLRKELSATQQEKKTIEDWAQTYRDEMEKVRWGSASVHVHVVVPVLHLSVHSVCTGVLYVPPVCVFLSFLILGCRSEIFPILGILGYFFRE